MLVAANLLQALLAPRLSPTQPPAGQVPFTLDEGVAAGPGMAVRHDVTADGKTPKAAEEATIAPQPDEIELTEEADAAPDDVLSEAIMPVDQIVPEDLVMSVPVPIANISSAQAWIVAESPMMPEPEGAAVAGNVDARPFAPPFPAARAPVPEANVAAKAAPEEGTVVLEGLAPTVGPSVAEVVASPNLAPVRPVEAGPLRAADAAMPPASAPALGAFAFRKLSTGDVAMPSSNGMASLSTAAEATAAPVAVTSATPAAVAPAAMPAPTPSLQDVASAKSLRPRPDTATTEVSAGEPAALSVVPVNVVADVPALDIPPVPVDPSGSGPTADALGVGFEGAAPEAAREAARKQAEAVVHAKAETLTRDSVAEDQGRVHVTLHRDGDDWRVVVSADNPATLDLMRRHADQLQQDLAQQGFGGAQLDFSDWTEPDTPEPPPDTGHAAPAPRAEIAHYTHSPLLPSSGLDLRL